MNSIFLVWGGGGGGVGAGALGVEVADMKEGGLGKDGRCLTGAGEGR